MAFHIGPRNDDDNLVLECVVNHEDGRVRGLQAGIGTTSRDFKGFRVGFLNDGEKASGFDLGAFNSGDYYSGLRIGCANGSANRRSYGFDLGFYNYARDELRRAGQMGLRNTCEGACDEAVQVGIINTSAYLENGLQTGAINYCQSNEGVQLGAVNTAETSEGFQLGLLNFSTGVWNRSSGVQIGLLNFRADNPKWFRYLPLISWRIGKKSKEVK